jgi:hypothetical protein
VAFDPFNRSVSGFAGKFINNSALAIGQEFSPDHSVEALLSKNM